MSNTKSANVKHHFSKTGFNDAVAHADYQQEEKGKRVAAGVENGGDDHEDFVTDIIAMPVLVVYSL